MSIFDGSVGNPRDGNDGPLGSSKRVTQCSPHVRLSPVGPPAIRAPNKPRFSRPRFGLLERLDQPPAPVRFVVTRQARRLEVLRNEARCYQRTAMQDVPHTRAPSSGSPVSMFAGTLGTRPTGTIQGARARDPPSPSDVPSLPLPPPPRRLA